MTPLLLLSRQRRGYTGQRLKTAAAALGYPLASVDPAAVTVSVGAGGAPAHCIGLEGILAVHLRALGNQCGHALAVLMALEASGARPVNEGKALVRLFPRAGCLVGLARAGIDVVPSVQVASAGHLGAALERFRASHMVLRAEGLDGAVTSVSAHGLASAKASLQLLLRNHPSVTVQPAGESTRVLVVGKRAVAAITWRSDGSVVKASPRSSCGRLAAKVVDMLELDVAGVDVRTLAGGPAVENVTAAPSLHALEVLSGKDLATSVVQLMVSAASQGRWLVQGNRAALRLGH